MRESDSLAPLALACALAAAVVFAVVCALFLGGAVLFGPCLTGEGEVLAQAEPPEPSMTPTQAAEDLVEGIDEAQEGAVRAVDAEADRLEHADFGTKVKEYLQYPDMPAGCEIMSMASLLRAMGYDVDAKRLSDDYLMSIPGEENLVDKYSGSPYETGAGFPPVMALAGNGLLRDEDSEWRFVEPEEPAFEELMELVDKGRPVLVWTTMSMDAPAFTDVVVDGYRWYSNEHCVVLYGKKKDAYLVMDPLEGLVERDGKAFEELFEKCGSHALVITRTQTDEVDVLDAKTMADKIAEQEKATEKDKAAEQDTPNKTEKPAEEDDAGKEDKPAEAKGTSLAPKEGEAPHVA